ncbi:epithelial cell adhesion molecule-like [Carassius auratus]|uniref:Epithelial cell adhesion molecule-like n=1 Tax=Carassius auratus TaxID=7957 RepID=A0A6P6L6T5_CARAU|nr:epithelial cell adhesion molecule-like [Carassius auratus]XP_026080249.1 epithelial cell adhesion molecule-like [Carassius auratus]
MKFLVALFVAVLVEAVASDCSCTNMKWATCDGDPCQCTLQFNKTTKQPIDCTKLIPKCFLMKAEMFLVRNNKSGKLIGGKPVETAFVDNDGIYDPDCENDGKFKAVQCNGTDVCWCVNSAGVRRSDKGDKNIKCEPVETYWVRLELKHKDVAAPDDVNKWKTGIENALQERYKLDKKLLSDVQYDQAGRLLVVDVKKPIGSSDPDLSLMTYYMEKDVKVLPLFQNGQPFEVSVEGSKVSMENILVYYVDEVAPTFTMQKLTGGVIAVIVVVSLIVIGGLLVIFFVARRQKAQYSKAPPREMETLS